jgi:hypothetical protein
LSRSGTASQSLARVLRAAGWQSHSQRCRRPSTPRGSASGVCTDDDDGLMRPARARRRLFADRDNPVLITDVGKWMRNKETSMCSRARACVCASGGGGRRFHLTSSIVSFIRRSYVHAWRKQEAHRRRRDEDISASGRNVTPTTRSARCGMISERLSTIDIFGYRKSKERANARR